MFIRFVVHQLDEDSNQRLGIIQTAYELRDSGAMQKYEEEIFAGIMAWFDTHLKEPSSFRRSKKYHAQNKAISWFKSYAVDHIAKMYELKTLLEQHDIAVEVIKTERTGFIVYEDVHQVVAEPFQETVT